MDPSEFFIRDTNNGRSHRLFLVGILLLMFSSCLQRSQHSQKSLQTDSNATVALQQPVPVAVIPEPIIDACYTFEEAIADSSAPESIIRQLELFEVDYLSTDGKIHRGQILTNKKIANDLKELFQLMLEQEFVIERVIPVVKSGWNDSLSMADNNSYSFCYRNISYSRHARGMAIDINPRFNPVRWKRGERPNQPEGAVSDTTVNGTFYPGHPMVEAFTKRGFIWGHRFPKFCDDHHFHKNQ